MSRRKAGPRKTLLLNGPFSKTLAELSRKKKEYQRELKDLEGSQNKEDLYRAEFLREEIKRIRVLSSNIRTKARKIRARKAELSGDKVVIQGMSL